MTFHIEKQPEEFISDKKSKTSSKRKIISKGSKSKRNSKSIRRNTRNLLLF